MQDRFKLRYWNNSSKRFMEPYATREGVPLYADGCEWDFDYIVSQCTGLKDKNGKLVYFDDLMKNKWGEICKVIMQTDKRNYGRVVLQNVKYLNSEAHKDNLFTSRIIEESEIIGNIYENPKLLEDK